MSLTCTILNASHEPLSIVPMDRGLRLIMKGTVMLLEVHEGHKIRSEKQEFPAPRVVVRRTQINIGPKYYGRAPFNNRNLFARDDYRCVYCHRHVHELREGEQLSCDHVQPVSKKGADDWPNAVTACDRCNHQKDDLSPDEIRHKVYGFEQELMGALPVPAELDQDVRQEYADCYNAGDYQGALACLPPTVGKRKQIQRLLKQIDNWKRYLISTPQKVPTIFEILQQRRKNSKRARR